MLTVSVKLFGPLRDYHPEKESEGKLEAFSWSLPKGSTIQELLDEIGIPKEEVKIVFVNNIKVPLDNVLNDNDEIGIFSPIAGG